MHNHMKPSRLPFPLAVLLLFLGCSSVPERQTVTLQCQAYERECFSFYSFTAGVLTIPPADLDQVDMLYYFDGNDCFQGALIGNDDRPGYLFPIGKKSWSELITLHAPAQNSESVEAITPLTKDKEGLAFWVKTKSGEYFWVRIKTIHPATYTDLLSGGIAKVQIEWSRPRTR